MKKYFISGVLALITVVLLAGCQNTIAGFGQDMQNTGHEIKKSVQ